MHRIQWSNCEWKHDTPLLMCRTQRCDFCRQSQLAKMTSELCEDRGEEQREKEPPVVSKASSVSPLSLELPGAWTSPVSPVTPPVITFSRDVSTTDV